MLTVGSVLKKERTRKKYSLDDISTATKIQRQYLEALESNDFSKFSSPVFAKGFLQNYAKFLDLNASRLLALYRRSVGEAPQLEIKDASVPLKSPAFVFTPRIIIIMVVGLLVAATFSYLIYQFYQFQRPPVLEVIYPKGNVTVGQEQVEIKGKTEPGIFVTINDEPVIVKEDGTFSSKVSLDPGTNTIIVKAKHPDNTGSPATVVRNIEYKTATSPTPASSPSTTPTPSEPSTPQTPPSAQTEASVTIKITSQNTWLEVSIDGKQKFAGVAKPGTTLQYTPKSSLGITTGKVSSTQLTINGKAQQIFVSTSGVGVIKCTFQDNTASCSRP